MKITKIHINALIALVLLSALQVWILIEMNGHLYDVLTTGCVEASLAIIFTPALAIAWIGKHFAGSTDPGD